MVTSRLTWRTTKRFYVNSNRATVISFDWLTGGGHVDRTNAFKCEQPAASTINRPVIESLNWLDFPLNAGSSIVHRLLFLGFIKGAPRDLSRHDDITFYRYLRIYALPPSCFLKVFFFIFKYIDVSLCWMVKWLCKIRESWNMRIQYVRCGV